MTTPTFSVTDTATWPVLLTVEHLSAIYGLSAKHINLRVRHGQFQPMPCQDAPRRWRRSDVLRVVEPGPAFGRRRTA